jgi:hypothetical protein
MKDLIHYIFYRTSKFHEDWEEPNGYTGCGMFTSGSYWIEIDK